MKTNPKAFIQGDFNVDDIIAKLQEHFVGDHVDHGIFWALQQYVAVLKISSIFYLFDSHGCGLLGFNYQGKGLQEPLVVLIKTERIEVLAEVLVRNLGNVPLSMKLDRYKNSAHFKIYSLEINDITERPNEVKKNEPRRPSLRKKPKNCIVKS